MVLATRHSALLTIFCAFLLGGLLNGLVSGSARAQRGSYGPDNYVADITSRQKDAGIRLAQRNTQRNYNRGYRDNSRRRRRSNIAGEFDYYAMVLSWSPSYCLSIGNKRRDPQCDRRGRRFSFVLHGLWPQYERGWPENCRTRQRPFVENTTIRSMLDIMPSKRLIIHEYKKHGTCSGFGPKGYYQLSRKLYSRIKIPARYVDTKNALFVTPEKLTADFIQANPGLKASHFAISCRRGNKRLREIRFCFARDGSYRDCGRNENRRKMCSERKIYLPPVRLSR